MVTLVDWQAFFNLQHMFLAPKVIYTFIQTSMNTYILTNLITYKHTCILKSILACMNTYIFKCTHFYAYILSYLNTYDDKYAFLLLCISLIIEKINLVHDGPPRPPRCVWG